jgi:hypothetical protein
MTLEPVPERPAIGRAEIWRQINLDAGGKEVESAATYSYMWLADQVGHMGLGILLSFATTTVASLLSGQDGTPFDADAQARWLGLLAAVALAILWEVSAYRGSARPIPGSPFKVDTRLLKANAVVAAFYMALGAVMGRALLEDWYVATPIILLLIGVAFRVAFPWVRQKIIWQKAGMPFLNRLACFPVEMDRRSGDLLADLVAQPQPADAPGALPTLVVVEGPAESGRTSLGAAIGTEHAFAGRSVRYLPFSKLVEVAALRDFELGRPTGPANIVYWPWSTAQVLIIDDIGPLLAAEAQTDDHVRQAIDALFGRIRAQLASRSTVWLLGEDAFRSHVDFPVIVEALREFLGVRHDHAVGIQLTPAAQAEAGVTRRLPPALAAPAGRLYSAIAPAAPDHR